MRLSIWQVGSMEPTFITKKKVRQLFGGISKSTVARWVEAGKLPKPIRRFGLHRWKYEELINLLRVKTSEKHFE